MVTGGRIIATGVNLSTTATGAASVAMLMGDYRLCKLVRACSGLLLTLCCRNLEAYGMFGTIPESIGMLTSLREL